MKSGRKSTREANYPKVRTRLKYTLTVLATCISLWGCQSRPTQELILAEVALKAAQKVKADTLAPDLYRKAENHYLRAKKDYAEGYYDSCRKNSTEARLTAEQSEYKALLKQTQIRDRASEDDFLSSQPDAQR